MRIKSNDIVILDTTDSKKIDLYISSNHPTVQIYDQNASQEPLTPDWSTSPLKLTPTVYIDSTDITDDPNNKFLWTKIKGSSATEEEVSRSKILIISNNELNDSSTIRYKCTVEYNGKSFSNEITFARIYTGKDGEMGSSAPAVRAQYSENGSSGWTSTLNSSLHKYIRFSYDNGNTWTLAIKMAGEDGTSVTIKGVAYAKSMPVIGNVIILYSDVATNNILTGVETGDSYLVDGYLCVYNADNNQFICTGKIQGPKGEQGDSYYLFIRYADDTNGTNISATAGNRKYIGFYRSSTNVLPTDTSATTWGWSKFVGDNAKSISLSASTQIFKVDKDSVVSPATLVVTAQVTNTSITEWLYSINGGQTFSSTLPSGVVRNGNQVTITGTTISSNSITIKVTDGVYSDTLTVYKVFDGIKGDKGVDAPIAFLTNENITFAANSNGQISGTTVYCNVVSYIGTTKVTPTIDTISGLPIGMTIDMDAITTESNELIIPIKIADNATLGSTGNVNDDFIIPVITPVATNLKLSWSKVNAGPRGETGVGIKSTTVRYGVSDSASTQPSDTSWQSTIPVVADGKYLWTQTIIDYTDDTDTVTYTYAKQGVKGDTGSAGSSVTVSKIEYQAGTSAITAPTGTWSSSVVSVAEGNYLWTKTTFSDNKVAYGVAKQGVKGDKGDKGDAGVGIASTTVTYGSSDSSSTQPTSWQTTIPTVAEGEYLWTRTVIDYTDTTKADTVSYIYAKQGSKGDTGSAGSSVTVKSIKYQAGTSATVAPTGTWSDSVVEVAEGNYLWTQTTFSDNKIAYGVAKQGQKGDQGVQGPKGSDGQQFYTWVKYADTPTSGMSNDPTGKTYIGLAYNKTTATESSTYSDYAWSLIKGETGAAGPKGEDGQQYYTWIKYADNASGANMSDSPNGKSYIGLAYNKTTSTESTTASDYTWALFKGDKGDTGANGTSASLVDITPSALYFKSTTGKNGTFTPDYIYLYPRFQTVTFSKWEYSVNGGTTWVAASGANGLTISTYNSIANTLRVAKTSTLYTDTITSISFRCVSSNASVYDTVSIAKLFDVDVEEINTRITESLAEVKTTTDSITSRVSATETSIGTINNNISSITNRVSAAEQKITPTAIVSTVRQSTDYTNDLGKKVNSSEIISKINQTAETITISANKIGLLGATNIPDLTADKIKGGTLTLGGSSAQTQNGQILVKNASDTDMIAINQYGMAISDGNLMIVDESEINEYGGWSSYSHTKLKTTGMTSMYIARNSTAEYHAEVDAIDGLTMRCLGGLNANPYYFHVGPTDGWDDDGSQIAFYQKLRLSDGTVSSGATDGDVVADISLNELVLPKANIILQDTAQKNIQFQNASKELRSCMLYAGANDSTTVMGAWDTTKSKSIFTYSTDNKFYILDSEAITKSMMQSSVGERGYQKLPSGLIIQWGYQGSALTVSGNYNITSGNITLPIAFPNSFTGIFCNVIEVDDGSLSGYYNLTAKANGLTGFTWKAYNYFNNWGSSILFSWIAIGY